MNLMNKDKSISFAILEEFSVSNFLSFTLSCNLRWHNVCVKVIIIKISELLRLTKY